MQQFYVPDYLTPGSGPIVTETAWKQVVCSECGSRPAGRIDGMTVRFTRKGELLDWVRTAAGILFRSKVAENLSQAHLSGWRAGVLSVKAVPRLQDQDLNYHECVLIGHTRSYATEAGLSLKQHCTECGHREYVYPEEPLTMPESCWDRSDVFRIDELGIEVVTEEFRDAVQSFGHTGIEFTPLGEWHRWWMPQT
jgi:hypothetical protein